MRFFIGLYDKDSEKVVIKNQTIDQNTAVIFSLDISSSKTITQAIIKREFIDQNHFRTHDNHIRPLPDFWQVYEAPSFSDAINFASALNLRILTNEGCRITKLKTKEVTQ